MGAPRTIEKLIRADRDMKIGNHRLEIQPNGDRWYYYYSTPIVKHLNPNGCWEFEISNGGWGTMTTKQNINLYIRNIPILPEKIVKADY